MSHQPPKLLNRYTFVDAFCLFWEKNRENHPRDYAERVTRFVAWTRGNGRDISVATLKAYLQHRTEGGANASTVNGYYYACKAALVAWSDECCKDLPRTEAGVWGWTIDRELRAIRRRKVDKGTRAKLIDGVKTSDIERVIRSASARNGVIIDFLQQSGLRIGELCRLRVSEVLPYGEGVAVLRFPGKGDKPRQVWVQQSLIDRVTKVFHGQNFLFETKSGRPLDPDNVGKEVKRTFLSHVKLPLTPHSLRHYGATRLIKMGLPIRAVSDFLGHADISTTATFYDRTTVTPEQLFTHPHGNRGRKRRAGDA